jgi:hypothetical protein
MKVDIKAGTIGTVINADSAHVTPPAARPAQSGAGGEVVPAQAQLPAPPAGDERWEALASRLPALGHEISTLKELVRIDRGGALNLMRRMAEQILHTLCRRHGVAWGRGEPTLENMLGPLGAAKAIPKNIVIHLRTVQSNTSPGSHFQEQPLTGAHVEIARQALAEVMEWFAVGSAV